MVNAFKALLITAISFLNMFVAYGITQGIISWFLLWAVFTFLTTTLVLVVWDL